MEIKVRGYVPDAVPESVLQEMDVEVDYSVPLLERPLEQLYHSVLTEEEKRTIPDFLIQARFEHFGCGNIAVLKPLLMLGALPEDRPFAIE